MQFNNPLIRLVKCTLFLLVFPGMVLPSQSQTPFVDITEQAGIDHQFVVFEGMFGGGACVFDLDNDGYEDVFITSGMNEDVLYRNNGDGTFSNIFEGSGLEVTRHYVTQGVAGADVNRDGLVDLYITTITTKDSVKVIPREKNLFFLNNGDNTFRDATSEYGLDKYNSFSTGASFGDVNADGYPDLYVGNYFLAYEGQLSVISDATIVGANQTSRDYLLLNDEGKRFVDAYEDYGLDHKGFGFGGVFTDYDNDGDQDLIVNNDFGYKAIPNYLLENQFPKNSFIDRTEELEMDLKINAMGTAVGDYNSDGFLDYYVTNIRINWFMARKGKQEPFTNQLKQTGLSNVPTAISWGANFGDFDHDGDQDLFVANGDLNPNCVPMANFYFENDKNRFQEKGRAMGVADYGLGRGSVVFDMDNDGDQDLLMINQNPTMDYPVESTTRLYRNDAANGNWLKVQLIGTHAETRGIGSRVTLIAGDLRMIREIDGGGSSHLSQNSTIAHFGLGTLTTIDSVVVTWTGGKKQVLTNQPVNQTIKIQETEDKPRRFPIAGAFIVLAIALAFFMLNKRK